MPRRDRLPVRGVCEGGSTVSWSWASSSWGINRRYWHNILQKKMLREMKHATPQIKNRPQKFLRERLLVSSTWVVWDEHEAKDSHLSWILCKSPFSESWRIAVDKSTARGESLWNACGACNLNFFKSIQLNFHLWNWYEILKHIKKSNLQNPNHF